MHFVQIADYKRWAGTNLDATAFASKIPTITRPVASATAAVLDRMDGLAAGAASYSWMRLLFILLGADNDVASFRLIGWNKIKTGQGNASDILWIPTPFAEFSCTASAAVGIASAPVINTERFCDTIAPVALMLADEKIAAGTSVGSQVYVRTPANDTIGYVDLFVGGYELLEFTLDQTTNTPPGNILYAPLRQVA